VLPNETKNKYSEFFIGTGTRIAPLSGIIILVNFRRVIAATGNKILT